jgi:hypothetical protein
VSRSRLALVAGAVLAVAAALVIGLLLFRPVATATMRGNVAVECVGIGSDDACAAWANSVLADGPGIHTFDPDDLERVRLSTSVLDLVGDCTAEYFVGRFGSEPVARETVPCLGG